MTTSPKTSSGALSSLVKQKWQEDKPFRYMINFILTVGSTEILALFTYLSLQRASILLTLIFAFVPAMFLWWAIIVIQNYDDRSHVYITETAKYKDEIDKQVQVDEKLKKEIDGLTTQFSNLIQYAGETLDLYPPFRKLLDKEPGLRKLIGHFINKSMANNAVCIWNITRTDFLSLAQEGIRDCKKCQLIHYGSLKEIQQHPYLNALQEKSARRIVILPNEYSGDVNKTFIVNEFLRKTGITPSYWIDEEKFFQIAELTDIKDRIRLDDCAIFDEQLLLLWQHDRRIAVLSFKGEKLYEGIMKVFEELEHQLEGFDASDASHRFAQIKKIEEEQRDSEN